ncbi:unnamed protein product [Trichobilharzia regenti]|nr:unnamed protein product [Trichobilharzia regenti]
MIRPLPNTVDIDESVPTYTINAFSPRRTSSPTPNFEHEAQRQIIPTTRLTQDGLTPLVNMTLHRSLQMDNKHPNLMAAINTQLANSSQRLDTESCNCMRMILLLRRHVNFWISRPNSCSKMETIQAAIRLWSFIKLKQQGEAPHFVCPHESAFPQFAKGCCEHGLSINVNKSHTINIAPDRQRKIMALSPTIFNINCQSIPDISPTEEVTYLSVPFNYKGRHCFDHVGVLSGYLENVRRTPIKPPQRINILKNNLIPRLLYSLTLSITQKNTVKTMDKLIRAAVCRRLHLQKYTPTAFFNAAIKKGGLGIMDLSTTIPSHRCERIEALLNNRNPLIRSIATSVTFTPFLRICNLPMQVHRQIVTSVEEAHESWVQQLHSSADGSGLTESTTYPESHKWLLNPEMVLPKLYARAVQLRGGLLGTRTRHARGTS